MEIISQIKSKLLPRTDVVAKIVHIEGVTPSEDNVKEKISKHFKCDKELINIEHIYTSYGLGVSKVVFYVYDDKKQMEKIVTKSRKQRDTEKKALEEAKKASAPVAEAS